MMDSADICQDLAARFAMAATSTKCNFWLQMQDYCHIGHKRPRKYVQLPGYEVSEKRNYGWKRNQTVQAWRCSHHIHCSHNRHCVMPMTAALRTVHVRPVSFNFLHGLRQHLIERQRYRICSLQVDCLHVVPFFGYMAGHLLQSRHNVLCTLLLSKITACHPAPSTTLSACQISRSA